MKQNFKLLLAGTISMLVFAIMVLISPNNAFGYSYNNSSTVGECVDLDGDGWGWDGEKGCRIDDGNDVEDKLVKHKKYRHHHHNPKKYKKYKKYKSSHNRKIYKKIKHWKKHNHAKYLQYKAVYKRYRGRSYKRLHTSLSVAERSIYKEYKKYRGYKKYRQSR